MTDIVTRLRESSSCDPECQGRCSQCPDDLSREAANEIERLRRASPPLQGWMPIESAPKDGTSIIIALTDDTVSEAYWHRRGWVVHGEFLSDQQTHWQPLPTPPAKECTPDSKGDA